MIRLSIVEITGPYCGTQTEGEKLYRAIVPHLRANEKVVLDFANVEIASSSFFNEVFGLVAEDFGEEILESHISYDSLKPRLQFVFERSQRATPA